MSVESRWNAAATALDACAEPRTGRVKRSELTVCADALLDLAIELRSSREERTSTSVQNLRLSFLVAAKLPNRLRRFRELRVTLQSLRSMLRLQGKMQPREKGIERADVVITGTREYSIELFARAVWLFVVD